MDTAPDQTFPQRDYGNQSEPLRHNYLSLSRSRCTATQTTTLAHLSAYHDSAGADTFELQELPQHTDGAQEGRVESKRERKRREKLERLREADEMKFSHSLQFNSVPDWSSHYIAYSNLKKL